MQYSRLAAVLAETSSKDKETAVLPMALFRSILSAALRNKGDLDESYYIASNEDIKSAIYKKIISSASDHYYNTGYFEGRMPRKLLVDEKFYLEQNPDVAEAIRRGVIQTAQEHFEFSGFREGRLPYKGFSLF